MIRVVVLLAFAAASCGGIRVGEIGPRYDGGIQGMSVPSPKTITLAPSDDAVVNADPAWAGKSLGDEEWLMAGSAPARGAYWLTYLTFELGVLPQDELYSSVTLRMPWSDNESVLLDVHVVPNEWDESTITWNEQPNVAPNSSVRLRRTEPGCESECGDLTTAVNDAIRQGSASLSVVIVPARPWESGVVRWASMESLDETATVGDVPTLRFVAGDVPPPPSAARSDWLLGLDGLRDSP